MLLPYFVLGLQKSGMISSLVMWSFLCQRKLNKFAKKFRSQDLNLDWTFLKIRISRKEINITISCPSFFSSSPARIQLAGEFINENILWIYGSVIDNDWYDYFNAWCDILWRPFDCHKCECNWLIGRLIGNATLWKATAFATLFPRSHWCHQ